MLAFIEFREDELIEDGILNDVTSPHQIPINTDSFPEWFVKLSC